MLNCLLIVDPQQDFIDGSLGTAGANELVKKIAVFLETQQEYDYVIVSMDEHIDPATHFSNEPDYITSFPAHCIKNTPGAALSPHLKMQSIDQIFSKGNYAAAFSAFEGTSDGLELNTWLSSKEISELDICGLLLDYCVKATAIDAIRYNYKTRVLNSFTIASTMSRATEAINELTASGVYIA